MANLLTVDVTSGVPTAGTGTVMTLNSINADGGLVTLGAKADAKSTATDTTAITLMSVMKQVSASVQALATAMSTNALAGEYEAVAASATDQVMGATGGTGDYLSHVIVIPAVAACGLVTIKDNTTAIISFVGGGTTAMPSVAPFVIPVGMYSASGAWKITTGSNVSCVAVGNFL